MSVSTTDSQPALYYIQTPDSNHKSIGQKLGTRFKNMFLCCAGAQDYDDQAKSVRCRTPRGLQISSPTNFRREEINIPGMTPSQECFIREKAHSDAERMFSNLQPLASSPSGHFAERPAQTTLMPTYDQFTQPRTAPAPGPHGKLSRMIAHTRKISGGFRTSTSQECDGRAEVEMRTLMDTGSMQVGATESSSVLGGKMSVESWESRHRDGATGEVYSKM